MHGWIKVGDKSHPNVESAANSLASKDKPRDALKSTSTGHLHALDKELARRASLLGKPGAKSKAHKAVLAEIASRGVKASGEPEHVMLTYQLTAEDVAGTDRPTGWAYSCTCGYVDVGGYADEDEADAAADLHEWLGGGDDGDKLADLSEAQFLSRLQIGRGSKLWLYWTKGKGTARWMGSANPWTTLRDALLKEGVPAGQSNGLATNIMLATPAGRALFKQHHRGKAA